MRGWVGGMRLIWTGGLGGWGSIGRQLDLRFEKFHV